MNTLNSTYVFKQKINWFKRFLYKFNKSKDEKFFELDEDTWYNTEIDDNGNQFIWSQKYSAIKLFNTNEIVLSITCPIGRKINIECGTIKFEKQLKSEREYIFYIETIGEDTIHISVDETFSPVDDVRELGLNFKRISIR